MEHSGNYTIVSLNVAESHLSEVLDAINGIVCDAKIKRIRGHLVVQEETVNIDRYLKENLSS